MATITRNDESLAERNEVFYPNADVIDAEPYYNNFTTIQNAIRRYDEQREAKIVTTVRQHSTDDQYRAIRTNVEPITSDNYYSNESIHFNRQSSNKPFHIPINIQSKKIDGHIFNLTKIVEDIGYDRNTKFMRSLSSSSNSNTKNVSALLDIVLKAGGAYGPLTNVWRSRINNDHFQQWYLDKYYHRSESFTQYNKMSNTEEKWMGNNSSPHHQTSFVIDRSASNIKPETWTNHDNYYQNHTGQMYGYENNDTIKSLLNHPIANNNVATNQYLSSNPQTSQSKSIHRIDSNEHFQTKYHINTQENSSINNHTTYTQNMQTNKTTNNILSDYKQIINEHPDVYNDPNPEMIIKPNPDQITYQQNVSVRYLVPPTPPPPGPLIIREIIPPRARTPSPLIIKQQELSPPTPPPLILREVPPIPPPHQETTILTKVLPPEPSSPRKVIIERSPPLPPKPQQIIIEKWLPYKPAPPRQVIYQQITEKPVTSEFETSTTNINRQRRHSAEYSSNQSRIQLPIQIEQRNSVDNLEENTSINRQRRHSAEYSSNSSIVQYPIQIERRNSVDYLENHHQYNRRHNRTFNELACKTHQQILSMQQQTEQQIRANQQWAANQWQQLTNMYSQYPNQVITPRFLVYHQPVTMNTGSYVQTHEYRQRIHFNPMYNYSYQ